MGNTGTWKYFEGRGMVQVSDRPPRIASKVNVGGEHVYCEANGETLDFGTGPVRVNSASEKRKVLRAHGVAPAPTGTSGISQRKYDPSSVPSFAEHFHSETGVPLSEAGGLVQVKGQ